MVQLLEHVNKSWTIVEGCCKDSADEVAEEFAKIHNIAIVHYPSHAGNYLLRNIDMVNNSDMVIAFWDMFSYGTAHTIAHAVRCNKQVIIIPNRLKYSGNKLKENEKQ
jgi:hypothetical protein